MSETDTHFVPHSSHWGSFRVRAVDEDTIEVRPHELDTEPSPIIQNAVDSVRHRARIDRPYVRRGWLEGTPREGDARRGVDEYVPLEWTEAERLLSAEVRRVYDEHGPTGVFGGSYGWSSAGRFHHAQSQVHRFLNSVGGYVRSVTTYSLGAGMVIVPRVAGDKYNVIYGGSTWTDLITSGELMLCFGGISTKNAAVNPGGPTSHIARQSVRDLGAAGVDLVNVSPIRSDLDDAPSQWVPVRPGTDVALMLGLAFELIRVGRVDREFLASHTTGYEKFEPYVLGTTDGVAKTAEWAAEICDIPAETIVALAGEIAQKKTFICVAPSLQRAEHGEQPIWMGITLAAMLGGIGLPGEGFGIGLGSMGYFGNQPNLYKSPSLPQGVNACDDFIPVARIADMLLNPGTEYDFNGERKTYPDIKLVYWAGGNPFHHHQDLFRLHDAFQRPDTVVVHDAFWTSTAKHADFVFPATMTLERVDIASAANEPNMIAMKPALAPFAEAKDDYDIFAALAGHLGVEDVFTEGRTSAEWVEHLYGLWRERLHAAGQDCPSFDEFWEHGSAEVPLEREPLSWLHEFRADPVANPLDTPSGRLEIFSDTIASFGYDDCAGHSTWMEPEEWLGGELADSYPLALISNQPAGRLHSQLDMGSASQVTKSKGRELLTIHPDDAARRILVDGDTVRVSSPRESSFLATVRVSDVVRDGVVQVATGAWFDPDFAERTCRHGNPNAVTMDRGTSKLGQGCIGQLCLVEVERIDGPVPDSHPHVPPRGASREAARK
ncbi:molybdopterin-dependent oxidoreductase [Cryobacterium arcticum]|uniref:Molybdopterin oxidoreductase n=1 Tax=Cryobacterium arcticum TaxID=670052 RepID=A0A318A0Z7_9MICO|nr:molybdopterin-dependent oxidoreductase [Cryobacterium arcticum]PXA73227.1 molybdopterin oxidoreductase [Cryobacterium arcticum]